MDGRKTFGKHHYSPGVKRNAMNKRMLLIGASGDIGQTIALQLVEQGYTLLIHYYKNRLAIDELVTLSPPGTIECIVQANLKTITGVEKVIKQIEPFEIDGMVYASGAASLGLFQDRSKEHVNDMLYLHVHAPLAITQYLLPEMIRRKHGHIVFITSIWGAVGASNEVLYSTVKGAQNSFIRALSKEVGPSGVYVNGVSPGFIDTKMNAHLSEEEKRVIEQDIPLQRAGTSDEVAHAVSFLLDERSSYIQGEIIEVTGGW